jgi:hypothetical protein
VRRRLYFLVHTLDEAKSVFDQLLLARVGDRHIHVLAKEGADIGSLPPATVFQKNDIVHSIFVGLGIGGIIGIIVGIIGHGVLNAPLGGVMLATTLLGAVLGAWSASMIGMMVPNRRLKKFYPALEKGHLLMIVDIPLAKVHEIETLIKRTVPHANFAGVEPTVPSVP